MRRRRGATPKQHGKKSPSFNALIHLRYVHSQLSTPTFGMRCPRSNLPLVDGGSRANAPTASDPSRATLPIESSVRDRPAPTHSQRLAQLDTTRAAGRAFIAANLVRAMKGAGLSRRNRAVRGSGRESGEGIAEDLCGVAAALGGVLIAEVDGGKSRRSSAG